MYWKTLENDAEMFFQMLTSLCDIYDEILHYSVVSCCAYLFWKCGYFSIRVNKVWIYWKCCTYFHRKTYKIDIPVILTLTAGWILEQIVKQSVDKNQEQSLENVQCGSIKWKSCQTYWISFSDEWSCLAYGGEAENVNYSDFIKLLNILYQQSWKL